ncbi:replication-relaxation family protein [Bacillus sp. RG28]|uniref:Replication-relaxation family protein n=1 Tax=Gottfriedia endophytica TaxID=2820819 RepID=A0A940NTG6_9BACI|nr:replication-relaxation family protein [Gottfriedia endophytica]MBP0726772.1 replication-relaxation family protein [Gottfriedia endophytica]
MIERDQEIVNTLEFFKCLSRDDLILLFFKDKKSAVSNCNQVLRRLRDRGHIKQSKRHSPAVYFPNPSTIKETSQKIPHYLGIARVYFSLSHYINSFEVEPKLGPKGTVEPDAFMIYNNSPYFVEIQLTQYNVKTMQEKIERYENYYYSNEWRKFPWQPDEPFFPAIAIFTQTSYEINSFLEIYQYKSAKELHQLSAMQI